MITIYYGDTELLQVQEDTSSYISEELMKKTQLYLQFSYNDYVNIPVGSYVVINDVQYILFAEAEITKNGVYNFAYKLTMYKIDGYLSLYYYANNQDNRLNWSVCDTLNNIGVQLVIAINKRVQGDLFVYVSNEDDELENLQKTIEIDYNYFSNVIQSVADTFQTEWELRQVGTKIHLSFKKVEYNTDSPLELQYGKDNGLIPGILRTADSDNEPIKRLYIKGSDRNITLKSESNPLGYDSKTLHLPKGVGKFIIYKGKTFYASDNGDYIMQNGIEGVKDASLDCTDIYPSRIGIVTSVEGNDIFIDDNINFNVNDYATTETAFIRFQTGMLAGEKNFTFNYDSANKRFTLAEQEIDGVIMPSDTFKPAVGDKYIIFNINMPEVYINDPINKKGAEWELFRKGAKYLYEHNEQKFTYKINLQGLWSKKNWADISDKIIIGGYINLIDPQFAKEGVKIRIVGIKTYLHKPYEPELELSKGARRGSYDRITGKLDKDITTLKGDKKWDDTIFGKDIKDLENTTAKLDNDIQTFDSDISDLKLRPNIGDAGWVVKNGSIVSAKYPNIFLNGLNGKVNLRGGVQKNVGISTENLQTDEIIYLPSIKDNETIDLPIRDDQVGRTIKLFNSSHSEDETTLVGSYMINCYSFNVDNEGEISNQRLTNTIELSAGETVEVTCYLIEEGDKEQLVEWKISNILANDTSKDTDGGDIIFNFREKRYKFDISQLISNNLLTQID